MAIDLNIGMCTIQINRAWKILEKLNLLQGHIVRPSYPKNAASVFRQLDYIETWKKCYQERYYNFELVDQSIIQFRFNNFQPLDFSYVYYECPYLPRPSFGDYIAALGQSDDLSTELENDYNDFSVAQVKTGFTPIRYDYCPSAYVAGKHPAAHLHFGFGNNIRIATKHILRPLSFVLFIVRQNYPNKWQELLSWPDAELLGREIRTNLDTVSSDYWQPLDLLEMHFY